MNALDRMIKRARIRRQARAQRKRGKQQARETRSQFLIEPLEQRILMSGDVLPAVPNSTVGPAPLVLTLDKEAGDVRLPAGLTGVHEDGLTIGPLFDDDSPGAIDDTLTIAPQLADPLRTPLVVTSFSQTTTGFTMRFNRAIESSVLSLYDIEAGTVGAADAPLVGDTVGDVKGSLIANGDTLTFVARGGMLPADTYTVTLRSAANGIKDTSGNLLDGNNDGTAGDNYTNSFTVTPSSVTGPLISIADFARGPGQVVNVAATDSGIPINLSDGTGVTSVSLTLNYNPALLKITRVDLASGLPAGARLQSEFIQPGVLAFTVTSATALGGGSLDLVRVLAEVPHTAAYGAAGILNIANVAINGGAALGAASVQVVAYFGDTTGNRGYSALDGQRALRVAAGLDAGFAAYPAIDPNIIADVTANGAITALDGTRILQEVAGLDRSEIQPITAVILTSLVNDSGLSATDAITHDARIVGTVSDDGTIDGFSIGLDNNPLFFDAGADLSKGSFNFSHARLEQLSGAPLSDGPHTLHLRARDSSGALSTVADFNFTLDTLAPTPVLLQLVASSDTGISASDGLTADATPTLRMTTEAGALVRVFAGSVDIAQGIAIDGTLDLALPPLPNGLQTLTAIAVDAAGNSGAPSATLPITVDTAAPGLRITELTGGSANDPVLRVFGDLVDGTTNLRSVQYRMDNGLLRTIAVTPAGAFNQVVSLADLGNSAHMLTLIATDLAGNVATVNRAVQLSGQPFRLSSISPLDGAANAGVNVQPKIVFSEPVNPATVTGATFFAMAGGTSLATTVLVDASGSFARLFFAQPLPGSTTVEITVNGSAIASAAIGAALDADDNGTAGGSLKFSFTTVSTSAVFGTSLAGRIADAGPDLIPLTGDDTLSGADNQLGTPDDIILLPLSGARVFAGGLENFAVLSNASGNFAVDKTAAGDVKLSVQGEPASAPAGFTFPELVLDVNVIGGIANQLGTIYLPRLAVQTVQPVNSAQGATIMLSPQGAMGLTEEQRQQFTLQIAPNSLLGADGQPVASGQVAVSVVPSDFLTPMLPATLPPALLSFALQARGFSDFAHPLRMTLPNLSDAPVESRLVMMSFDPATGKLIEDGTAIVVAAPSPANGLGGEDPATAGGNLTYVEWDPGEEGGLTACFHILLPDFSGLGGVSAVSSSDCDPETTPDQLVIPVFADNGSLHDYFFTSDSDSFTLHFENAGALIDPTRDPCDPVNQQATPMFIDIIVDGAATFLDGLETSTYALHPQTQLDIEVNLRDLLTPEILNQVVVNALYGAKVDIIGTVIDPNTGLEIVVVDKSIYVYRLFDVTDDNHTDGRIDFERTLNDNPGGISRNKAIFLNMPDAARPTIAGSTEPSFRFELPGQGAGRFVFDPAALGDLGGSMSINSPNGAVDRIGLFGKGVASQQILFDKADFLFAVAHLIDRQPAASGIEDFLALFPVDSNGDGRRSDEAGFGTVIDDLYNIAFTTMEQAFGGAGAGTAVTVIDSNLGNGIALNWNNVVIDGVFPGTNAGLAVSTWLDIGTAKLENTVNEEGSTSLPQEAFRFEKVFNQFAADQAPGRWAGMVINLDRVVQYAVESFPRANRPPSSAGFAAMIGNVLTHEAGHLIGGFHPIAPGSYSGIYASTVMGDATSAFLSPQSWGPLFSSMVKLATGIPIGLGDHQTIYSHYKSYLSFLLANSGRMSGIFDGLAIAAPLLTVFDGPFVDAQPLPNPVASSFDFNDTIVDGPGGTIQERQLFLVNAGDRPLTVSNVSLAHGNAGFSIQGLSSLPIVIPAADENQLNINRYILTLRFDPSVAGAVSDRLRITSDTLGSSGPMEIVLNGQGVKPFGNLAVDSVNNNLGGLRLSDPTRVAQGALTLRNDGASALTIAQVNVLGGARQFGVTGLPADFGAANPLVLAPGEQFSLGVTFNANAIGLQRAQLQLISNDGDSAIVIQGLVATGLPDTSSALDYGDDYVALQTPFVSGAPVVRTVSSGNGHWDFSIRAGVRFDTYIFDPVSGLISHSVAMSASSGAPTESLLPVFRASSAPDSDGDGLPDDVEFAIGSASAKTDTDNDGVDDFTEIALGLSPLDGVAGPTGIIGALLLPGEAWDIATSGDIAYVATGSHGLAVVAISDPEKPMLLGSKDLSGSNVSVAIDEERLLAALADQSATPGLHIVNIANPTNLIELRTVPLAQAATHVEVFDGVAYVASGTVLVAIELQTGNILQTLDLGGTILTGLAREGRLLVTVDNSVRVSTIEIVGQLLQERDNVTIIHTAGAAFVGDGIAYLTNKNGSGVGGRGGFATANVSDPATILFISNSDVTTGSRPDQAIGVDSSGRALVGGNAPNPQNPFLSIPVVDVANVSDPSNTDAYLSRFLLPEFPLGVLLASGFALIADGTGDLQVINYRSLDAAGVAPVVSAQAVVSDADLGAPGIQVIAGSKLQVRVDAVDDTLVKKVELLVNGALARTDASFPYEALITVPESGSFTVQARATDIGGNVGLSNLLSFQAVSDNVAPTIVAVSLANGTSLPEGLQKVTVRFSEPLALATVTSSTFRLSFGGQDVTPTSIALLSDGTLVELNYSSLFAGPYELIISGAAVTDLAGNPLSASNVISNFTLTSDAIEWINPAGGFWDVAANWEGGILPGPNDNVLIDVPGNVSITHRSGTTVINRLISRENLALTGGVLQVNTTAQVDGSFTFGNGGTLRNATLLPAANGLEAHVVSAANFDNLTLQGNVTIDNLGSVLVTNGLTLAGARLTLASTGSTTSITFPGDQTLDGTGEIFFGGASANNRNAVDGGTLTIGPGITVRGTESGSVGNSFTDETIIFEGKLNAETSGETIILGGLNTQIKGIVRATNGGTVSLDDTFSFQQGGAFQANGGNVIITGTLDNTGKTLALNALTGSLRSNNGTIVGGRIETGGGAELLPQTTITLDGVTLGSSYNVPDGTDTLIRNGLTLDGVQVVFTDGSVAFVPPRMRFLDSSTLGGNGQIVFSGTGDANMLSGTTGFTWTIGPNIQILGDRGGTVGSLGSVINQGMIWATNDLFDITVSGVTVNNQGMLLASTGGDIILSGSFANTGTIDIGASGSQVRLISGTILQNDGVIFMAGGTLQATTVSLQGGVLSGFGTVSGALINNASIFVGGSNTAGNLQVAGAFTQNNSGVLNLEIGGTTAGTQFDRLQVAGAASLDGLLVVSLFNNFTPSVGQNFAVVTYGSHGTTMFAGIDGLDVGAGRVFNPIYNPTNLTLNVAASPAPPNHEVPLLTNDTIVKSVNGPPDGLKLDLEKSAALSKQTGKEWLFYMTE